MEQNSDIYKKVKRLEDDLRDFKATQPVGTDSVITYRLVTNNEWDFTGNLPSNTNGFGNSSRKNFVVTYISRDQIAPFARCFVFGQYNGGPFDYSAKSGLATMTTGAVTVSDWIFYLTPEELANPQIMKFYITMEGVANTPFKLKFGVDSTDLGQIQIYEETPSGDSLIAYGQ